MAIALVATDPIEGLEVRSAPVGGVIWDRGALVRLEQGRVSWSRRLDVAPLLAAAGRRLYVAFDDVLACLDARTGADVWTEGVDAPIRALAAHRDGVDAVYGGALRMYATDGSPGPTRPVDARCEHLVAGASARYVGGPGGVWRVAREGRPTKLSERPCISLHAREAGVQALVAGQEGTQLVEDEGLPLVWSFPDVAGHLLAPYGRGEWAVVPTQGRSGVWVVDRRVQARWHVDLPGRARALAVAGPAVAVLLDDGGAALAVTHPDVSRPLLLEAPDADELHADGDALYLAASGRTRVYRLREA